MKALEILKTDLRIEGIQNSTRKAIHLLIGLATVIVIFFFVFS